MGNTGILGIFLGSEALAQVKSLASQPTEQNSRAKVDTTVGLEFDAYVPNWPAFASPFEVEAGAQTDDSCELGTGAASCLPEQPTPGQAAPLMTGTWGPLETKPFPEGLRVRLIKQVACICAGEEGVVLSCDWAHVLVNFDIWISGTRTFSLSDFEAWTPQTFDAATSTSGTVTLCTLATQVGGKQLVACGSTQASFSSNTVETQTDVFSHWEILEYGDAIRARHGMLVCGCPSLPPEYNARHDLLDIPAGEVGIVKKVYGEKAMIKADFPNRGVGFLSCQDIVGFDLLLNMHPESDRMQRRLSAPLP